MVGKRSWCETLAIPRRRLAGLQLRASSHNPTPSDPIRSTPSDAVFRVATGALLAPDGNRLPSLERRGALDGPWSSWLHRMLGLATRPSIALLFNYSPGFHAIRCAGALGSDHARWALRSR